MRPSGVLLKMEVGIHKRGLAKGLKVPCLFMIAEVSIRCQENPEVGIRCIPPPQYTTVHNPSGLARGPIYTEA